MRDPVTGCPWDRVQTFATIAPYTLEEAYEVVDAIEAGEAPAKLRDELGDLLFQVVFYAQLAQERGWFDFDAIARAIHDKLVRRHPHVFGESALNTPGEVLVAWEELKARERAAAAGVLADVPRALPALTRAQKLGKRAGRVGFDWTDMRDVRAKISEELAELDEAALEARDGGDSAAPPAAPGGGDGRPAVRDRQLGATRGRGCGRGAARGQCQVRTPLRQHGVTGA